MNRQISFDIGSRKIFPPKDLAVFEMGSCPQNIELQSLANKILLTKDLPSAPPARRRRGGTLLPDKLEDSRCMFPMLHLPDFE